jgi:glucuronokinase
MFRRVPRTTTTARAFARAALVGNPSDGYGGRTIAFAFSDLHADVTVKPAPRLMIDADRGEAALLRAAYGRFVAHCIDTGANPEPCALSVRSSIPPEVGLAGSSAIVIAALRALCEFQQVAIPEVDLPTVALAAEDDLDIPAGLQDRVAQVYEGLVYMDFEPRLLATDGHGLYTRFESDLLDHAYVAWRPKARVISSRFHGELRRRVRSGDREALGALAELAELTAAAKTDMERGDLDAVAAAVDRNFDLRRQLGPLESAHVEMIEVARAAGASANYAGSGGAICGFAPDDEVRDRLTDGLSAIGCTVIKPTLAVPQHA